jgi:hypothetical protein
VAGRRATPPLTAAPKECAVPLPFTRRGRFACLTVAFLLTAARSLAAEPPVEVGGVSVSPIVPLAARDERPAALLPLYSMFASLQVADAHSTLRALARGGREVNPLLSGFARSPGAVALVKGASFVGIVYASEKLWHRHRALAVLTMVGLNAGYSAVTAHNYLAVH